MRYVAPDADRQVERMVSVSTRSRVAMANNDPRQLRISPPSDGWGAGRRRSHDVGSGQQGITLLAPL